MMKILLQFVLPVLVPGLIFLIWTVLTRKRSPIAEGPWFRLILAGFGLMLIGLAATAITGGMDPGGTYQAPYLKNGEVMPGGMIRDKP